MEKKFKFRLNDFDDFEYDDGSEQSASLCRDEVRKFLEVSQRTKILNLHISDERPQDDDNFHVLRNTPANGWRLKEIDCRSPYFLGGFCDLLNRKFTKKTLYAWAT